MDFEIASGIDIEDTSKLKSAYQMTDADNIAALAEGEQLLPLLYELCAAIPQPVFFFLELPLGREEEKELGDGGAHYRLYYLDNCTSEVIKTILDEYGSLLAGDGVCRFGFGGNESGDEIYVQSYKVMSIYTASSSLKKAAVRSLEAHGLQRTDSLVTPWDIISKDNSSVCVSIEEDGITLFDLPEMLKNAGMYESGIV